MALTLTSPAFGLGAEIPARYTADGENISPPLEWSGVTGDAKSLVLIVEDPDAPDPEHPQRTWVHWLLYNIPPGASSLPEGVRDADLPEGTRVGSNDWGRKAWGGPDPAIGQHRYFFRLYALDTELPLLDAQTIEQRRAAQRDPHRPDEARTISAATKLEVERAMAGHVLAEAELMGTYQKGRRHAAA
jgi:Raf kinase inhibitor-like YbhB/YbcL family protein